MLQLGVLSSNLECSGPLRVTEYLQVPFLLFTAMGNKGNEDFKPSLCPSFARVMAQGFWFWAQPFSWQPAPGWVCCSGWELGKTWPKVFGVCEEFSRTSSPT